MLHTLSLLASAIAALGHLLFALSARRSGHAIPRAFARLALGLFGWSFALFLHDLFTPQVGDELPWIAALALPPLGLRLAAKLHGTAPRLERIADLVWIGAIAAAVPLVVAGARMVPVAAGVLYPGLFGVLIAVWRASVVRGERATAFLVAAGLAIVAALVDTMVDSEATLPLPRLAGIASVVIVALLGSAVARHGLFELRPLLGRTATLAVVALGVALALAFGLERVADPSARLLLAWVVLLAFALLQGPLLRFLRSPAARALERRRRELIDRLGRADEALARATSREELDQELQRALVGGEVAGMWLTWTAARPPLRPEAPLLLALRVGGRRLGWLALKLVDDHLVGPRVLRHALRSLASRVAIAAGAIEAHAEQRRNERLAQLGGMAASIAHEIKNPLGAILGALDLLEVPAVGSAESLADAASPRVEQSRWLAIIRAEARRLDRVVTDALALGREPRLEKSRALPRSVAEGAVLLASERAKAAGVELTLRGGDAASPLEVALDLDVDQVRHALLNLLLNSISVQPKGGRVELAIERVVGPAVAPLAFHVRDDGPGIPPALRARIFEPYFTTRPTGSGLGLAVAQRVAIAHGGRLELAEADGGFRGAHFVLTLPTTATTITTATTGGDDGPPPRA